MIKSASNDTLRQRRLQRQIERIERRITRCEALSRRYSWARLVLFLAGGCAAWTAAVLFDSRAGWITLIVILISFTGVVLLHRRLDHRQEKFRIWREIYIEQLARLSLDWAHIPTPAANGDADSPLATDLDLCGPRSLHHLLDAAISRQGSRRLADWLTTAIPNPAQITARQAVVRELKSLPHFRNRLTLTFRLLTRQPLDAENLLGWLQIPYPEKALQRVLPWATLLAVMNIGLLVLNTAGVLPPVWVLSALAYAAVYFANQSLIGGFLAAVIRLDGELDILRPVLHHLESFPYRANQHLAQQCAPFLNQAERPSRLLRQIKWATAAAGLRMNPALGLLLNLLTPWDFWAAWLAARQRQRMARLLPAWLDAFHELEALISLGAFASLNPEYTFPEILPLQQPGPVLATRGLGHPLLDPARKVCNDFQIEALGELNLLTGSNMSGKSTFIRTVGVNLCLAYAGGPVNADSLQTIPFRLYTCIRIRDSLGDGFSYFYAEVKRLKGLLESLEETKQPDSLPGLPLIYLIDEIFRGTNNREPLIGSRAYVRALLGAPGVGWIATHDLELATLADQHPQAHNYHFRDDVAEGKLVFDYRLRPGPSPTTNALKIMALEGLPVKSP